MSEAIVGEYELTTGSKYRGYEIEGNDADTWVTIVETRPIRHGENRHEIILMKMGSDKEKVPRMRQLRIDAIVSMRQVGYAEAL